VAQFCSLCTGNHRPQRAHYQCRREPIRTPFGILYTCFRSVLAAFSIFPVPNPLKTNLI
jgi:hypothetical protein